MSPQEKHRTRLGGRCEFHNRPTTSKLLVIRNWKSHAADGKLFYQMGTIPTHQTWETIEPNQLFSLATKKIDISIKYTYDIINLSFFFKSLNSDMYLTYVEIKTLVRKNKWLFVMNCMNSTIGGSTQRGSHAICYPTYLHSTCSVRRVF